MARTPYLVILVGVFCLVVELRGLKPLTPCLQRAGTLWHTVAELAVRAMQDRTTRQIVGACCGQDCGQRSASCPAMSVVARCFCHRLTL
jgi:hypothetical protein